MSTDGTIIEPMDAYNESLISHVHPPGWKNPIPNGRYNMVVIGAGTAGLVTAVASAGMGAKVALIERHLMGGDCLNVGCVPSKALIRSARAVHDARMLSKYGGRSDSIETDFGAVMERMRRLRAGIAPHDSAARFKEQGVDVFLGSGRFTGPRTIEVGGQQLDFSRACIATGARASAPPIPGLEDVGYLTNETLFSLTEWPRRLAIIGGGPIGVEMAQSFSRFGSEVHLLERGARILGKDDPEASEVVATALLEDGVNLHLQALDLVLDQAATDKRLSFRCSGEARTVKVDEVLVAVGRAPNVEGLGLEPANVAFDTRRGVEVDDRLRTTNKRVFAAGDVCSRYQFTHTADHLARIVIRNALFPFLPGKPKASQLIVPWCTYSDPEVAHVGLTERELGEQDIASETIRIGLDAVDRAILEGETEGFLKVHVAKGSDRILGATLVSRHAGETIGELTIAMANGVGLGKLASVIHPYPTQAEIVARAADAYNRTKLTPRAKMVLSWLMRRQR